MLVGDKDTGKEKAAFRAVMRNLAAEPNLKFSPKEIQSMIDEDAFKNDSKNAINLGRMLFKKAIEPFQ